MAAAPDEGCSLGAMVRMLTRGSLVISYAACSASMLIVNKWALNHFPLPATLTLLQCAATAVIVLLVRATGALSVDRVTWIEVWRFLSVPVLFALALYSSSQLLHHGNAGLQILVRTTTPVAVCIADYLFMGYDLPAPRSAAALVGLVVGAVFYFGVEAQISLTAAFWSVFYFVAISTEMVWVKRVLNEIQMSTWTRVLITNAGTTLLMLPFCIAMPERARIVAYYTGETKVTLLAAASVGTSCVAGFFLSFSGFKLRESVSATTFTFVGVVCKFATVLVNQVIWVHHGSTVGALVLCASIGLSSVYVAPKKREVLKASAEVVDDHDEKATLVAHNGPLGSSSRA